MRRLRNSGIMAGFLLAVVLTQASAARAQTAPDRSGPPPAGPVPVLGLPLLEKHTLSNGLPVWVVGMHEVPMIDLAVVIGAGGWADPDDRAGLAHYTAAMLDEGAGPRDALELADAIDFLGASLTTSSSFDATTVRLQSLVSTFGEALPLAADVVRRPTFADADVERLRAERLTSLLQVRDSPSALADAAHARLLFGADHRYGTPLMGTDASNRAMAAADLRAFHEAHYRPGNARIIVAGDVSADTLLPALEEAFGGWQDGAVAPVTPAVVPPADAPRPTDRRIYLVDKPGAVQSEIRLGAVGVARSTPDFFPLEVMNIVLGGSFTSRLNQNLREEHGYAYGAGSGFSMRLAAGPFVAQAAVQVDSTVESLVEFFREFEGMQEPVPPDELARARSLEALSFPRGFETTGGMVLRLVDLAVYDLPDAYFEEYVQRIQGVTPADVQRVAVDLLTPDELLVVVVGDLAVIEEPVRAAEIAPVIVVSVDDILD